MFLSKLEAALTATVVTIVASSVGSQDLAHAADNGGSQPVVAGPEFNPYMCQGLAEVSTNNRSVAQMEQELARRMNPVVEPDDPPTLRAVKFCAIGEIKRRLGHAGAEKYYRLAIAENPGEPGYEFFLGRYFAKSRGAKSPVLEKAEDHLYAAVDKLERLNDSGRRREHHDVLEDELNKLLMVLYQQDGFPLLPWKTYPYRPSGHGGPSLKLSSQVHVAKDTRDVFYNSEMSQFTSEAHLSEFRKGEALEPREAFDIARAPLRYQVQNRLRIRQNFIGAIDLIHSQLHLYDNQILTYNEPSGQRVDVDAQELGVGYERVFDLMPLFDLRLKGAVKRVNRIGVVEFLANERQIFPLYEAKGSVGRFLGTDKLTLNAAYVFMDIPTVVGGPPGEGERGRSIWSVSVEYANYRPLLLPALHLGSLNLYRTPTRGWYFYGGYDRDDEVYGIRRVVNDNFHLGTRLEGPGPYNIALEGKYNRGSTLLVDINDPQLGEVDQPELRHGNVRTAVVVVRRLANPDATPGMGESTAGFTSDELNLVFPLNYDIAVAGHNDYENVRGGLQIWWKLFSPGLWGTTFLSTVGYEYQYFYRIKKAFHTVQATLRMGWGDL